MELESYYEISGTAEFIRSRNFTRVALQFPDELLKDSTRVVSALRNKLSAVGESNIQQNWDHENVRFFVMADTTYGSCCVDEVAASHANADCVIHYGHTCLSPTSVLPAYFVFGKAVISISDCVEHLSKYEAKRKPILVLYGLEYLHAMKNLNESLAAALKSSGSGPSSEVVFADVVCSIMDPLNSSKNSNDLSEMAGGCLSSDSSVTGTSTKYSIGGLTWNLPDGHRMEDYLLFWIGTDNSAFSNVVLTFSSCEIVRYDATENQMVTDFSQQRRILKRRYYLVEKAKDANMIGILVGTLGVAGYLHMIHQMKELIGKAGKKAYTLVMGRPNPAKLANFPECDVFINVSCAQTALLDSKEFLAPIITPYEAMLAFNRGSQWTGSYVTEFRDLIDSSPVDLIEQPEEPRYSFFQGGYVEDIESQETVEGDKEDVLALSDATNASQLSNNNSSIIKGSAKSVAEFFSARSFQGLELHSDDSTPEPYVIGRSGKASGYKDEKSKQDTS